MSASRFTTITIYHPTIYLIHHKIVEIEIKLYLKAEATKFLNVFIIINVINKIVEKLVEG